MSADLTQPLPNSVTSAITNFSPSTTIDAGKIGSTPSPTTFYTPPASPTPKSTPYVAPPAGTVLNETGQAVPAPAPTPAKSGTSSQDILEKMLSGATTLGTEGTVRSGLESTYGVDTKTQAATDSYNRYNQAKVEFAQQLETMRTTNPTGQFGGARAAETEEFARKGNANLANLAVIANMDANNLSAAQSIIKDKLDSQFQPIKDQLDAYSKIYPELAGPMKTELAGVTKTADEIHAQLMQNNAPASVYSSVDKVIDDYTSGKITGQEAKSQMAVVAGNYGVDNYKLAQLENIKAETQKKLTEATNNPDSTTSLGEQLVRGLIDPTQLSKRTANYNAVLKAADDYSMATTGKHYDVAKASRDFKYASNPGTLNTLNYLGSLIGGVGKTGNLDELVNLSNAIPRTEFPALNKVENWVKLETGNPLIASYRAVTTEVADQVAKVLQGGGTGSATSDAKLTQAMNLFQSSFTADQVIAVVNSLKPLLINRAKNLIGDNPYLSDYADDLGISKTSSKPVITKENTSIAGLTVTIDGQSFTMPDEAALNNFKKDNGL